MNKNKNTSKIPRRDVLVRNYDFLLNKKTCKVHNEEVLVNKSLLVPIPSTPSKKK